MAWRTATKIYALSLHEAYNVTDLLKFIVFSQIDMLKQTFSFSIFLT